MKNEQHLKNILFEKTPDAISYQKIFFDERKLPCDYEIYSVNGVFEKIFGVSREIIVGKKFSDFISAFPIASEKWLSLVGKVALQGATITIDYFVDLVQKWMRITIFPLENGYFAMLYVDVTKEIIQEKELQEKNIALMQAMREVQKANALLRRLATTDELTGLFNRHFFEERVAEEIERADRYNEPLSLIVFDLDHFKNVNDVWGHPVGDEVLKKASFLASEIVRKTDTLNRIGGEEFAVLMPRTTLCGGLTVAEKLRQALGNYDHPQAGTVTASFGVAERMRAESFQSWYRRADAALYRAKNEGRNCVVECCANVIALLPITRLQWQEERASGDQNIDEQHRELLALTNNLITISSAGVRFEQVMVQLDLLLHHIEQHFKAEGIILSSVGYPDATRHASLHKKLFEKVLQMKELYRMEGLQSAAFFSFIIDDVVVGHICKDDVLYFPYLKNKQGAS